MLVNKRSASQEESGDARLRILEVAERLLMDRGIASVTLREMAAALGLTHAAFYHHFPGGKDELFAEVVRRNAIRHGRALEAAKGDGSSTLRESLLSMAEWLVSQPAMDLVRMARSDLPAIDPAVAGELMALIHGRMLAPIRDVLAAAAASGRIDAATDVDLVAGGFLALIESLHAVPDFALRRSRPELAVELTDTLLRGIGYRKGEPS